MTGRESFNMAEDFAGVDFNEEWTEKRFRKTMKTPAGDSQRQRQLRKPVGGQGHLQSVRQQKVRSG